MDPHLSFWTLALLDLLAVVACAGAGWWRIRRRDLRGHRRLMLAACALVALFLLAYLVKLARLGREDRAAWDTLSLAVLYVHEACIAVMLSAGAYAGYRAWRFRATLGGAHRLPPEPHPSRGRIHHRRAGRTAVVAGALAFVLACAMLAGMYARA